MNARENKNILRVKNVSQAKKKNVSILFIFTLE